jgi:hypothetical protein
MARTRSKPSTFSILPFLVPVLLISFLQGCNSSNGTQNPPPTPLSITTRSLPNGQVGVAYSTSLSATGGTIPYT